VLPECRARAASSDFDPVVVGGGKRIFRDDGVLRLLRLVDSRVTTTGAIIATYAASAA
jgi:hypothetical protein